MVAITKKLIEEVKTKVSIVDLASEYYDLVNHNGYYTVKGKGTGNDFSSVVIYPITNTFFRNSNRKGGDVISFVLEANIEGIDSFQDAVAFLKKRIDPNFTIEHKNFKKKKSYFEMKKEEQINYIKETHETLLSNLKPDDNNKNVIAYLINERHIDKGIVYRELEKKRIMQCVTPNGTKGVAFIAYNYGLLSAVSIRGINNHSHFKGDLKGCNYDLGWVLYPKSEAIYLESKIYCFEGYIDMLSYQTFLKQKGIDDSKDIFVCCGSANKYKCVTNLIKQRSLTNDVVICFDNDTAGKKLGEQLKQEIETLPFKNKITKEFSKEKDWNEDLKKLSSGIKSRKANALSRFQSHNSKKSQEIKRSQKNDRNIR